VRQIRQFGGENGRVCGIKRWGYTAEKDQRMKKGDYTIRKKKIAGDFHKRMSSFGEPLNKRDHLKINFTGSDIGRVVIVRIMEA